MLQTDFKWKPLSRIWGYKCVCFWVNVRFRSCRAKTIPNFPQGINKVYAKLYLYLLVAWKEGTLDSPALSLARTLGFFLFFLQWWRKFTPWRDCVSTYLRPFSLIFWSSPQPQVRLVSLFHFSCYNLLIPCGIFGPPRPGKATAAARTARAAHSFKCMLGLFVFPQSS